VARTSNCWFLFSILPALSAIATVCRLTRSGLLELGFHSDLVSMDMFFFWLSSCCLWSSFEACTIWRILMRSYAALNISKRKNEQSLLVSVHTESNKKLKTVDLLSCFLHTLTPARSMRPLLLKLKYTNWIWFDFNERFAIREARTRLAGQGTRATRPRDTF